MRCMVLNASFEFLSITSRPIDAISLVLKGKATPLATYEERLRAARESFALPALLVLKHQIRTRRRHGIFDVPSRKAVFLRDGFTCQYCGARVSMTSGTRDHVLPRSRGGRDILANVVTACMPCNTRKDNRTPEEAGMHLAVRPRALSEDEKIQCLLKTCRSRERDTWLQALNAFGIRLWTA
jgi:5-methylcytosine-specific restriction endonuclease McrA